LRYIDPQARVLFYCSKRSKQSSINANDEVILSLSLPPPLSFLLVFLDMRISLRCVSPHLFVPHCVCGRTYVQVCVWMFTGERWGRLQGVCQDFVGGLVQGGEDS